MDANSDSQEGTRTGVATNIVDAVTAIGVMILGGVVLYGSRKLGSGWTSDGPGAGYFQIGRASCRERVSIDV